MKILDENNVELPSPDLSKGRLVEERLFVSHHPAVEAAAEQWHYETIAEYPNGGKDVKRVVDVPGAEAQEAWDEYEIIQRYVPYTEAELAEIEEGKNAPTLEDRVETLETTTDDMILLMADLIGGE